MRAGGTAAGEAWGVGRVSVVPGLELPPRFLGSQVRVCLALSPCLRVDGLSVGVPLGPRVPSALVCLALSPCLRVDGLSVCGCPFGSLGPECVCLPGSVSMSPGGWAVCLWVSLWVLGSQVCVFAWLCLHISRWMGCLSVGVPLGLGLCMWVSVCFSILQQPGSQLSHICALLLDLDSFLPKLSPSHSLGAPLPLTLTSSLDSVLLEVSGSGQREDTRCSVSPAREALSRPRGMGEDRSSPVRLWRLGWLTEL